MRVRRVIRSRLRRTGPGWQVAGDLQAVVAVNIGESTAPEPDRGPDAEQADQPDPSGPAAGSGQPGH